LERAWFFSSKEVVTWFSIQYLRFPPSAWRVLAPLSANTARAWPATWLDLARPARATWQPMVEAMEAAAENAQAQFSNIEAAMRQQLAQFRANASSEGSLTDDVMGESPSIDHRPKSTAAPWLRTPKCASFARPAGFYHAVDWSEPWLKGLLAFHVTVWVLAIATRKLNDVQIVLLLCIRAPHSPCLRTLTLALALAVACCPASVRRKALVCAW